MYDSEEALSFLKETLSEGVGFEVKIKRIPYKNCIFEKQSGFEVEILIKRFDVKEKLRKILEKLRNHDHKYVRAYIFPMLHRTRAIVSCKDADHRAYACEEINRNFKGDRKELFICSCGNVTESRDKKSDNVPSVIFQVGFSSPQREEELTNLLEPLLARGIINNFFFDKS